MKKIKNLKHLLGEKLIVLSLELLNDVFVIEQFLDGAVGLAELFLDWGAAMLAIGLPEVAVKEAAQRYKKQGQNAQVVR